MSEQICVTHDRKLPRRHIGAPHVKRFSFTWSWRSAGERPWHLSPRVVDTASMLKTHLCKNLSSIHTFACSVECSPTLDNL